MQALKVDSSSYTNNAQENTRNIHGNHTIDGHTKSMGPLLAATLSSARSSSTSNICSQCLLVCCKDSCGYWLSSPSSLLFSRWTMHRVGVRAHQRGQGAVAYLKTWRRWQWDRVDMLARSSVDQGGSHDGIEFHSPQTTMEAVSRLEEGGWWKTPNLLWL